MGGLLRYRVHIICALAIGALFVWWTRSNDDAMPARVEASKFSGSSATLQQPNFISPPPIEAQAKPAQRLSTGLLRGRVIDVVTELPIQEFQLELQRTPAIEGRETPQPKVFRQSNGRFEWSNVPAERWRLIVTAHGYQQFELNDLQVDAATPDLLIPLRPGRALSGRVYDRSTGKGIADAQITFRESHVARSASRLGFPQIFKTDARGAFTLTGMPSGRVTLTVKASVYADREIDVATNTSASVEIAMSSGSTIAGLLTASDGVTAIPGTISLLHLEHESSVTIGTEPNGEFAFEKLEPGRYRLIGRTGEGRVEHEIQLAADERLEGVVLAIQSGGMIRGVVRGLRPQDWSRFTIHVQRPNAGRSIPGDARIDEHGSYVLNGVEAGRMVVVASIAMRRQLTKVIDMPANGDVTVDFDFPPGVKLSGRVTRGGAPFARVMIEPYAVDNAGAVLMPTGTDANGEYLIDDLAEGEYVVRVGHHKSPVVRVAGDTVFDIEIPLTAHFAGRVVESDDSVPIVGATVDIWAADTTNSAARLHASSDHRGEFALSGLEPGQLVITVHKPGYELYREQLTYGSPISDRTIRLRQSRGVDVQVRDARTSEPLRGVQLTEMLKGATGISVLLHLDENGYAQMPAALAGSSLRFSAPGFMSIVVPRWSGSALQLSLRPEHSLPPPAERK